MIYVNFKTVFATLLLLLTTANVNAWDVRRDFNSGALGATAERTPDGFDDVAGGSKYNNERVFEGAQSAKLHIKQGDTAFGKWGGIINFPTPVRKGGKVWLQLYVNFPQIFQVSTGAGSMKFLRFYSRPVGGGNGGSLDLQIIDDQETYAEFRMLRELQFIWYSFGQDGMLTKDQWHRVNVEIGVDDVPVNQGGSSYVKFWFDGVLLEDQRNIKTLIDPTDEMYNFLLFTYYNGGSPIDQHVWVDDINLSNSRPVWMDELEGPVDRPLAPVLF